VGTDCSTWVGSGGVHRGDDLGESPTLRPREHAPDV
jgi:hypothetical protein